MQASPLTPSQPVRRGIPRHIVVGAIVLAASTVLLSGLSRQTGIGRTPDESGQTISRMLIFERIDGNRLAVIDAPTGKTLDSLPSADEGFIAGALRGLNFERRRKGKGLDQPYRLIASPGKGIALIDPQTGLYMQLEAFGSDNVAALAKYLPAPPGLASRSPNHRTQ